MKPVWPLSGKRSSQPTKVEVGKDDEPRDLAGPVDPVQLQVTQCSVAPSAMLLQLLDQGARPLRGQAGPPRVSEGAATWGWELHLTVSMNTLH
eukprot:757599-Amphidinium_carterae.1